MTSITRGVVRVRWRQVLQQGLLPALQPYFPTPVVAAWPWPKPPRRRRYPAAVCLWGMVFQALSRRNSDEATSQQVAAWLSLETSPRSGAYSKARHRLPLVLVEAAARAVAQRQRRGRPGWLRGRRVRLVDGTCVSLADTAENQSCYPQPRTQAPGCGFPVVRVVVVMDAGSGAVLDWAYGDLETAEVVLLQRLWDRFERGDVVVMDRGYASYAVLAALHQRGVEVLVRQHQRRLNQRPGQSLDWLETWPRPRQDSAWCTDPLPLELRVRVLYHRLPSGRWLKLNTTLPRRGYPAALLAELYRDRWRIETQFGQLKQGLGLDALAAKTPEMAAKVLVAHFLALNLLTALRVDTARCRGWGVWEVGLTSLVGAVTASGSLATRSAARARCWAMAMATPVPDQPGRQEPRVRKRRPKNYRLMTKPRDVLRQAAARGRA